MNGTTQGISPRAVLWDMDGTLIDSTEYHWLAWKDTMAAESRPLTYKEFIRSFGQRNDVILRGLLGANLSDGQIQRISSIKERHYRELVRTKGVEFLPGVQEWLIRLQSRGWRQAVASSAPRTNIHTVLEVLGAVAYFNTIVSGEDVQRGKPDPQVFLLAAERIRVPPDCCVVVEDAPAGIEAAHSAGMRALGVLTSHPFLEAEYSVKTLNELSEGAFESLLER